MSNLRINSLIEAENMRCKKIQNLISLLQGNENSALIDAVLENQPSLAFEVGRRIAIDGETIKIGKQSFSSHEIEKVTINAEGSMAIYNRYGKRLCGSLSLNVSQDNIELFCVWVHKYNISVEVLSGKGERFFQYMLLLITAAAVVLREILK